MMRLLWICVAGAAGVGARHLVAIWAARQFGAGFPFGTLLVNVLGCFLIAVATQAAVATGMSPALRAPLTIGFLGGFTTYSSFNQETMGLVDAGMPGLAFLNAAVTLLGGLAAGWCGLLVARHWWPLS